MTCQPDGITHISHSKVSAASSRIYSAILGCIAKVREFLNDKRRVMRIPDPPLRVCYSTGGPALYRTLRDISPWGAFIPTDEDWLPGTAIYFVLERRIDGNDHYSAQNGSFGVWGRVVRRSPQGLGVKFLVVNRQERVRLQQFLEDTVREALLARAAQEISTHGAQES
jgi:hypothetical protein